MEELIALMRRLRDPDTGCPWDRAQSFRTIAPYTIEEAYEVADAITRADFDDLKDELGDLLFQVVFHAQMAEEAAHFSFADVVAGIVEKMVRRHPHVFGECDGASSVGEVQQSWETIKARERLEKTGHRDGSALAGVAANLPSLQRATKLQRRAARVGFDWPDRAGVIEKVHEELRELEEEIERGGPDQRISDELGDLLFSCVNLARHCRIDADRALREANARFEVRFRHLEKALLSRGKPTEKCSLAELEEAWQAAKQATD